MYKKNTFANQQRQIYLASEISERTSHVQKSLQPQREFHENVTVFFQEALSKKEAQDYSTEKDFLISQFENSLNTLLENPKYKDVDFEISHVYSSTHELKLRISSSSEEKIKKFLAALNRKCKKNSYIKSVDKDEDLQIQ